MVWIRKSTKYFGIELSVVSNDIQVFQLSIACIYDLCFAFLSEASGLCKGEWILNGIEKLDLAVQC